MEDVFDFADVQDNTVVEQEFEIIVDRSCFLAALKMVIGVVENSQILQILSHVKMIAKGDLLTVMATDSEVELVSSFKMMKKVEGEFAITVPGKKLLDVFRTLPDGASVSMSCTRNWVKICASDNIEFTLSALPSEGFPVIRMGSEIKTFSLQKSNFTSLLSSSSFAMAHSDVRHFLNGMLFSFSEDVLKVTATDGHRLAIDFAGVTSEEGFSGDASAIIPRKAVLELAKLIDSAEGVVEVAVTDQHVKVMTDKFILSTRLLEGDYPDCEKLIPDYDGTKAIVSRVLFKQALSRAAVLAKEKYHGVRLSFTVGQLKISSTNSDNEKAEEVFPVDYDGDEIAMAFNISYLLDVVNVLSSTDIDFVLSDPQKCVLLKEYGDGGCEDAIYVVMPMTL
ncbi:MAG: DNA polymerase III subunit beta [Legionellales bacterium]|jgi:DNA polymerase III subunit beta|nr:DNA polymerase III subunit beta [Legionellales bacterium]